MWPFQVRLLFIVSPGSLADWTTRRGVSLMETTGVATGTEVIMCVTLVLVSSLVILLSEFHDYKLNRRSWSWL